MSKEPFQRAIRDGSFVVTGDCLPPRGVDARDLLSSVEPLSAWVSAVYVPENEDGPRMSSLAACSHLLGIGAQPILALVTRDQNRVALQSNILGAESLGVTSVFCTAGHHQALTSSSSARGVFDVDPVQLVRIAAGMRASGELADGTKLDKPIDLVIGTDTNPFAEPIDLQLITLEKASRAGADFVITQPVSDLDRFNIWMSHVRESELHTRLCVIASVSTDDAAASEIIGHLRGIDGVRGIHLMTGGDVTQAAELIKTTSLSGS